MVRKTKEEASETKDRVLRAAAAVFFEKGVAKASLEEIAHQAGVTRGAIYWHFKNKLDIFQALHEQLHVSCMDMILQDLEKNHTQPLQQLEELCINLLLDLEQNTYKKQILSIFVLKCDYSGEMQVVLREQMAKKRKNFSLFENYFSRAKVKGHLPPYADPGILTLSLTCYFTGVVNEYLRNPDLFDLKNQAVFLMQQFFAGVKSKPV